MSLVVRGLTVMTHSSEAKTLLFDIDGCFQDGHITLLVGSSGAGKSTLLHALSGLQPPSRGTVEIDGLPLYSRGRAARQSLLKIGCVEQFPEDQLFAASVAGEMHYSLHPYRLKTAARDIRARQTLTEMGIPHTLWTTSPLTLSGGLKRRVAIASTWSTDAGWLLFDEPTAGLDAGARRQLIQVLLARRNDRRHGGLIIATHHLDELLPIADEIWVLQDGCLQGVYAKQALLRCPEVLRRAGLGVPESLQVHEELRRLGFPISDENFSPTDVASTISRALAGQMPADAVPQAHGHCVQPRQKVDGMHNAGTPSLSNSAFPEATSWIHGIDARAKWTFFLCLTIGLFLQTRWLGITVSAGVLVACAFFARVDGREVVRGIRPIGWLMGVSTVLSACTIHKPPNLFFGIDTGPVQINLIRAEVTLRGVVEFGLAMGVGILIPTAISRVQMSRGLEQMLRGGRQFGFPVEAVSLALTLILRFLPMLRHEVDRFARIAQARGKQAARPNRLPIRSIPAAILPLILSILRLGEDFSMALESRGLKDFQARSGVPKAPAWRTTDWVTAVLGVMVLGGLWTVRGL